MKYYILGIESLNIYFINISNLFLVLHDFSFIHKLNTINFMVIIGSIRLCRYGLFIHLLYKSYYEYNIMYLTCCKV